MKKTLYIDIETMPMIAAVWRLYETNAVWTVSDWYICTVGYKWAHEKKAHVKSIHDFPRYAKNKEDDKSLMEFTHKLLDEADEIIAHNGDNFDIRKINARLLINKFPPPSPYKTVDTLKIARRHFALTSNKLNYIAQVLGIGEKEKTGGEELWRKYMAGDKKALMLMPRYCIKDVYLLEKVHLALRPWSDRHNHSGIVGGCRLCGSLKVIKRGKFETTQGIRQRHYCNDCRAWSKGDFITKHKYKYV